MKAGSTKLIACIGCGAVHDAYAFGTAFPLCCPTCGEAGSEPPHVAGRSGSWWHDRRRTRDVAGILHFLTPQQMAEEIVRLDAVIAAQAADGVPGTDGGRAMAELCGILHGRGQPHDDHGCALPWNHEGPHEFIAADGERWQWETDLECDCDWCSKAQGDYCTTYWRKADSSGEIEFQSWLAVLTAAGVPPSDGGQAK